MSVRSNALKTVVLASFVSILVGCSGGEATGPDIPQISGSYSGTWTLTAENQDTGESSSASCPGSITIDSQSDGSFTGSYRIDAGGDCDTSDSGTASGNVRSDGGIDLSLGSASGSSSDFEDVTGCTVTGGDSKFTGSVSSGSMTIDAEFFADCPDGSGGTIPTRWVFDFNGS